MQIIKKMMQYKYTFAVARSRSSRGGIDSDDEDDKRQSTRSSLHGPGGRRKSTASSRQDRPRRITLIDDDDDDDLNKLVYRDGQFLRAKAGTAIARLSYRNSVRPSVRPSVTRVDQAKMVQARISKSSPSAA